MRFQLKDSSLPLAVLSLAYFPLLFHFRYLDDNTLTNWKWVFQESGFWQNFLFFTFLSLGAHIFSQFEIFEKKPSFLFLLPVICLVVPGWRIPEVILDTSRYFISAKYLELYGTGFFIREWGDTIQAWTDLPLVPFIYGLLFKLFGESRLNIQIWNTALYYATILLTVNLGQKLWNRKAGWFAGTCLLGMPYLITQVPLMLVDISTMFFFTLALSCDIAALEKGGFLRIFVSSAAIMAAALTKFSVWPLSVFLPVVALVFFSGRSPKSVSRSQIVVRSAGILVFCFVQIGVILWYKHELLLNQLGFLIDYQWAGLDRWRESFTATFLFQSHPIITIAACYGLICAVKKRDAAILISLCLIIVITVLQLHRIRYLIPLFPLYALIGGYGIYHIKRPDIQNFLTIFMVGSSFIILHAAYYPFLKKNSLGNLQKAGEYLNQTNCEQIRVITKPQTGSIGNTAVALPMLDLYTSKALLYSPSRFVVEPEKIRQASLRFSWENKIPDYYQRITSDHRIPLLVISSARQPEKSLVDPVEAPGRSVTKRYNASSGVFRFKTYVTIFGDSCDSPAGSD